ncbi:hypothetical protein HDU93_002676 [Gonapodya sp. JEL0774]|nr:hypothetical protein HDU93_002676 [Gonapodya sp. JEL0774]
MPVPKSDTLDSLHILLTQKVPSVRGLFHAFRFRNDWHKKDLAPERTVGDAADAWPDFLNKRHFLSPGVTPPLKSDEPLELQLITRTERLQEIDRDVLYAEKRYWHHAANISYLKSLDRRQVLSSDNHTNNNDSVSTHTDVLEEQILAKRTQISSLRSMMIQWRAYSSPEFTNAFAASLPPTVAVDDVSISTIQFWLRHIRDSKAALNRVPNDLADKFVPFLRQQLQNPPKGFTTLWEAEEQQVTPTGTMTMFGELNDDQRKEQAKYVETKTAQLDQVSEEEIVQASTFAVDGKASESFTGNKLVTESFRKLYPGRTDKATQASIEETWGYLTEVEKKQWWKRDAWISKMRGISSFSYRNPNTIAEDDDSSFTVASGYLLWGQLATIAYAGVMSPATPSDAPTALPERLTGGTIIQHVFSYRAKCRNGTWKVARISANYMGGDQVGDTPDDMMSVGWIVYHESVNPGNAVLRASRINGEQAISNGNTHVDKGVVYINRYDWSWHWAGARDPQFSANFSARFHDDPEVADLFQLLTERNMGGHFAAVDAGQFSLDMLDCGMAARMNRTGITPEGTFEWLFQGTGGATFGACVQNRATEYELGWHIYEPVMNTTEDGTVAVVDHELVAFVYDAAYHALDADRFIVDGRVYPTADEVMVDALDLHLIQAIERRDRTAVVKILGKKGSNPNSRKRVTLQVPVGIAGTRTETWEAESAAVLAVVYGRADILGDLIDAGAGFNDAVEWKIPNWTKSWDTKTWDTRRWFLQFNASSLLELALSIFTTTCPRSVQTETALIASVASPDDCRIALNKPAFPIVGNPRTLEQAFDTFKIRLDVAVVKLLLDRGAVVPPGAADRARRLGDPDIAKLFVPSMTHSKSSASTVPSPGGVPLLLDSIENRRPDLAMQALRAGINPNVRRRITLTVNIPGIGPQTDSILGESALAIAVMFGMEETVRALLDHGADPHAEVEWRVPNFTTTWTPHLWSHSRWFLSYRFPSILDVAMFSPYITSSSPTGQSEFIEHATSNPPRVALSKIGTDIRISNPIAPNDSFDILTLDPEPSVSIVRLLLARGAQVSAQVRRRAAQLRNPSIFQAIEAHLARASSSPSSAVASAERLETQLSHAKARIQQLENEVNIERGKLKETKRAARDEAARSQQETERLRSCLAEVERTLAAKVAVAHMATPPNTPLPSPPYSPAAVTVNGGTLNSPLVGNTPVGNPVGNPHMYAIGAFKARYADEVNINVGDKISLERRYEDGWAEGSNITTGQRGIFPASHIAPNPPVTKASMSAQDGRPTFSPPAASPLDSTSTVPTSIGTDSQRQPGYTRSVATSLASTVIAPPSIAPSIPQTLPGGYRYKHEYNGVEVTSYSDVYGDSLTYGSVDSHNSMPSPLSQGNTGSLPHIRVKRDAIATKLAPTTDLVDVAGPPAAKYA